jgi:hypothetical protein
MRVKLRAATFFLTNLEYSKSVEMCDTFITFPPTYKMEINDGEYIEDLKKKMHHQLFHGKTSDEIENIMNAILPMLCRSFKLKSLPNILNCLIPYNLHSTRNPSCFSKGTSCIDWTLLSLFANLVECSHNS